METVGSYAFLGSLGKRAHCEEFTCKALCKDPIPSLVKAQINFFFKDCLWLTSVNNGGSQKTIAQPQIKPDRILK